MLTASGLELKTEFLNSGYQPPQVNTEAMAGKTGHLELFRLAPRCPGLPTFVGRIGHDDQDAVDVDLIGKEGERSAFRSQAPVYVGHRTKELGTDPRSYRVHIRTPEAGHVFTGTLILKSHGFGRRIFDSFAFTDVAEAVVTAINRDTGGK